MRSRKDLQELLNQALDHGDWSPIKCQLNRGSNFKDGLECIYDNQYFYIEIPKYNFFIYVYSKQKMPWESHEGIMKYIKLKQIKIEGLPLVSLGRLTYVCSILKFSKRYNIIKKLQPSRPTGKMYYKASKKSID